MRKTGPRGFITFVQGIIVAIWVVTLAALAALAYVAFHFIKKVW